MDEATKQPAAAAGRKLLRLAGGAAAAAAATAAVVPASAGATETISYRYDARGRLVRVERTGGTSAGITSAYTHDRADNRTSRWAGAGSPPAAPSFSVSDASASEGDALVFTVTKTGATSASFSLFYSTAPGSAAQGDFSAAEGTLVFAANETSRTVTVQSVEDTSYEPAETFALNLSSPSGGATISDREGTGTIQNDDNQPPTTVADSGGTTRCTVSTSFNVTANDSDADGDLPLTLIAVSGGAHGATSVASGTSVGYAPTGTTGTDVLTYTIQDSRGATATGTLTVTVISGDCPPDP